MVGIRLKNRRYRFVAKDREGKIGFLKLLNDRQHLNFPAGGGIY